MCASFSSQSIKSLLLFLPPLVFSFFAPKPKYGHIFALRSMLKDLSKEARRKEFGKQEEELRLDTLEAENICTNMLKNKLNRTQNKKNGSLKTMASS